MISGMHRKCSRSRIRPPNRMTAWSKKLLSTPRFIAEMEVSDVPGLEGGHVLAGNADQIPD